MFERYLPDGRSPLCTGAQGRLSSGPGLCISLSQTSWDCYGPFLQLIEVSLNDSTTIWSLSLLGFVSPEMKIYFISNFMRVYSVSVTRSLMQRLNRTDPGEDLDEEGIEYLRYFCVLCHPSPLPHSQAEPHFSFSPIYSQCACSSPSFHVLCQIQLQVGFGFPNPHLCMLGHHLHVPPELPVPVFTSCVLPILTSLKQLVLQCRPLSRKPSCLCLVFLLSMVDCSWIWRRWSRKKKTLRSPYTSSLWAHIPWESSKQNPVQAQVFSPEVQSYGPVICALISGSTIS